MEGVSGMSEEKTSIVGVVVLTILVNIVILCSASLFNKLDKSGWSQEQIEQLLESTEEIADRITEITDKMRRL